VASNDSKLAAEALQYCALLGNNFVLCEDKWILCKNSERFSDIDILLSTDFEKIRRDVSDYLKLHDLNLVLSWNYDYECHSLFFANTDFTKYIQLDICHSKRNFNQYYLKTSEIDNFSIVSNKYANLKVLNSDALMLYRRMKDLIKLGQSSSSVIREEYTSILNQLFSKRGVSVLKSNIVPTKRRFLKRLLFRVLRTNLTKSRLIEVDTKYFDMYVKNLNSAGIPFIELSMNSWIMAPLFGGLVLKRTLPKIDRNPPRNT
jgi:hypothetical protein